MERHLTRRGALTVLGGSAAALPLAARTTAGTARAQSAPPAVYLGGYTGGDPEGGIGVARPDQTTGALRLEAVTPAPNPSFLALSPATGVLYAVDESAEGAVTAFALDDSGGIAGPLATVGSGGGSPCHVSVDPGGSHAFAANYATGSVAVFALGENGAPTGLTDLVQHTGEGPDPDRQEGPHAHMVLPHPDGGLLYAADLGTDSVHVYVLDTATGRLTRRQEARFAPGSGPRHLALHPGGRTAYVLGELDLTLTPCTVDAATGTLTPLTAVSALPPDADPAGATAAEVLVSPDGRFVYASVRGHDSVAVFDVAGDRETAPELLASHPCGGRSPRHLAFDAASGRIFAANQDSSQVSVLTRDTGDGGLSDAQTALSYPNVACVLPAL
ncbi:lactonase family protein [Streptomyces sp. 7-21]|uniref:lactonase family protein n=1 Tax=Streptomyces sp. 7-21 TaxID=2802283 RepID=UPI00191F1C42|nr:lactonase family protein [Streptomyces sp. 7-21]MBL1067713.1 lactonase family protein [Streptomyces sp. 7-21]